MTDNTLTVWEFQGEAAEADAARRLLLKGMGGREIVLRRLGALLGRDLYEVTDD